jgi:hypothetical protein
MYLIKFLIGVPFFFRDKALFFMRKHIAKLKEHKSVFTKSFDVKWGSYEDKNSYN